MQISIDLGGTIIEGLALSASYDAQKARSALTIVCSTGVAGTARLETSP